MKSLMGVEGLPACRGTDRIAAGEDLRKEIGDAPPSMNVTREWSIFAWSGTVARLPMTTTS